MKRLTTEGFISLAKAIHGNRYNYSKVIYKNKYTKIKIYCNKCKKWFEQVPRNHLNCKDCPSCKNTTDIQTTLFIEKAKKIHKDKYDYKEVVYKSSRSKVKIFCKKCLSYFDQSPSNHLSGKGCPKCGSVINKTTEDFIAQAKSIHGNKYDYSNTKYVNNKTKVKIYCKNCNTYFLQTPINHLTGCGCSNCNPYKKLSLKEFIHKASVIHNNIYDYSMVKYINSRSKINIFCKKCNKFFKQKPNNHLIGNGCPFCKNSKGEIQIKNWLDKHSIKYEAQKRFSGCKDIRALPFDFYLPTYNLCIEYQGRQHYDEGFDIYLKRYKTKEKAKLIYDKQKYHDDLKKAYCKQNGLNLLEIKYNEDIIICLENVFNKNFS